MAKKAAKKITAKPAAKAKATSAKPAAKSAPKPAAKAKSAPVKPPSKVAKSVAPTKPVAAKTKVAVVDKPAKVEKVEKASKGAKAVKGEKKAKVDKTGMSDDQAKWADLYQKYKSEKPQVYSMMALFEANKPIQHKVLGWGFVLSNENDRLEVLFEQGIKMLISNYKPV